MVQRLALQSSLWRPCLVLGVEGVPPGLLYDPAFAVEGLQIPSTSRRAQDAVARRTRHDLEPCVYLQQHDAPAVVQTLQELHVSLERRRGSESPVVLAAAAAHRPLGSRDCLEDC